MFTPLVPGTRLGRYELLHPIGAGGMGQVWAAEQAGDLGFRKLIALKTVLPEHAHDASIRAMLLEEARLASRIRHANVVEVLDLGVDGHVVFQAMTFVEGASLSAWKVNAPARRVPLGAGLRIVIDMLRGLHAAHELCDDDGAPLGLVHRDVSPHNVLVGMDGVAKLTDFGIAKAAGRATEETSHGDVKGKLGYVAPELLDGIPPSPQSDIFSAGVILWEVLVGRRLFEVRGLAAAELRRRASVRDPRELAPHVSERLAAIAMRALARDPSARFSSARAMADTLEDAIRALALDATHQHVAAALEADLGPLLRAQCEVIRSARQALATRSSHVRLALPVVESVHARTAPVASRVVGPPSTEVETSPPSPARISQAMNERSTAPPLRVHDRLYGLALMMAVAVLVFMGGVVLHRSPEGRAEHAPPSSTRPPTSRMLAESAQRARLVPSEPSSFVDLAR